MQHASPPPPAMADEYRHLAEDEDMASLEPSKKREERNVLKASHPESDYGCSY